MLQPNMPAPDFVLPSDDGREVKLSDYRGQKVVLYFYPKDDTPGCTTEACGFRDSYSDLLGAGAAVLGVSPDPVQSHVKFRIKFSLPFALLSDPDHRVAEMYGSWGEKKRYGRTYEGILRTTYVIDENGTITHVFPNVKVQEHSAEVLAALRGSS